MFTPLYRNTETGTKNARCLNGTSCNSGSHMKQLWSFKANLTWLISMCVYRNQNVLTHHKTDLYSHATQTVTYVESIRISDSW